MPSIQAVSTTNRLLDVLTSEDRQHLMAHCEMVRLVLADVLSNPGDPIRHVYFPINSVISLVKPIDGGGNLEVGLIGNEGMLGITLMLGVDVTPFRALVQGAGAALRITAPAFLREIEQSRGLQRELQRYLYVSFSQLMQTAVCNRFHLIEERLARLLLMIRDRVHAMEFHITQELLAQMLGVRRVGVTKAACSLQEKKLISYSRGDVRIHNIIGLEAISCACYRADKETYDRILQC